MIIGVPKEIKPNENRVGLTPSAVAEFVHHGHEVLVQKRAGEGSGISDKEFVRAGAKIVDTARDIFDNSQMVVKVKEPQPQEIDMLKEGQIIYTYLHLAPDRPQTLGLMEKKVVAIAYETIEVDGKLPLLEPMSEVAGKMASIMAAYYLAKPYGGRGVLAGGVTGVHSAKFVILGGGTAGLNAAKVAAGMGASVYVLDINTERLRYLEDVLPKNCRMIMSSRMNIEEEIKDADAVIGTVLIPGAKTPKLIRRDMLKTMKKGSVIVDVSIDQGGCVETSKPTTHQDPVFEVDGVLHYCVANMPGAYARTSTFALVNATLPFGLLIADLGWIEAAKRYRSIAKGLNVVYGKITCKPVAEAHGLEHAPVETVLQ
ncbi:alanine dehydrogenase [Hippea maritima]|uniref:Alanine dehydrogenase n=1 Tax=Hippea maritima (strain ATCC 700847 / DSM 10411 / MH2) TaxID=760142 RepID=F2LY50_HIPMA|nr:alanine dehydrogenase [Hippea maritima]AEA34373.1 alanine dehydrogenase [Hippea maritima DSM 10411]